jgi:hypothetical protein
MGPVFRAHDPAEGRLVAIKAFQLDLTPAQAADFVKALDELPGRGLEHPSIAAPVAAGLEGMTPWLAQAYVPAESLDSALRQYGPAPVGDALAVITQLAGALDFAAAAGVLHGALHPRDVLVAPDDTHLIDIGIAPALEAVGGRAPIRRPYAAPERIDGAAISRATDVFALGVLACELLTGQRIAGAGDAALLDLPQIPGANHDALLETLGFALAIAPDERYTSALTFAAALKRALGEAATRPGLTVAPAPRRTPVMETREPSVARPAPSSSGAAASGGEARRHHAETTPTRVAAAPGVQGAHDRADTTDSISDVPVTASAADAGEPVHGEPFVFPAGAAPLSPESVDDLTPHAPAADAGLQWDAEHEASSASNAEASRQEHRPMTPAPHAYGGVTRRDARQTAILIALAAGVLVGFLAGWGWSGRDRSDSGTPAAASGSAPAPAAPVTPTEVVPPSEIKPSDTNVTPEPRRADAAPPSTATSSASTATPRPQAAAGQPAAPSRPSTGQLTIRSTPSGARVEINGRARGTTPLTVRDLALGSMTVRLTRSGYQSVQRRVTLSAARNAQTIDTSLERSRPAADEEGPATFTGSVLFETHPSGVNVYLDNKMVGVTPFQLRNVRAGSHVVRMEKTGFKRWTASVRVVAGQRIRVAASLEEDLGR